MLGLAAQRIKQMQQRLQWHSSLRAPMKSGRGNLVGWLR